MAPESQPRKATVSLYLLVRALHTLEPVLTRNHYPSQFITPSLVFSLANGVIVASAVFAPQLISRMHYNFVLQIANLNDRTLNTVFREPLARRVKYFEPFFFLKGV